MGYRQLASARMAIGSDNMGFRNNQGNTGSSGRKERQRGKRRLWRWRKWTKKGIRRPQTPPAFLEHMAMSFRPSDQQNGRTSRGVSRNDGRANKDSYRAFVPEPPSGKNELQHASSHDTRRGGDRPPTPIIRRRAKALKRALNSQWQKRSKSTPFSLSSGWMAYLVGTIAKGKESATGDL